MLYLVRFILQADLNQKLILLDDEFIHQAENEINKAAAESGQFPANNTFNLNNINNKSSDDFNKNSFFFCLSGYIRILFNYIKNIFFNMEGGDIRLFITLVPKLL